MDNLQALRNSKAALDLGLITQSDYDGVKAAFLGAQQLRAAMDAGLIREDDFEKSKFAYLSSLSTFAPHIEKPGQVAIQPPPLDAAAPLRTSVLNGARQATLASHPVPSTQPQHTEPAAAPKYLVGGSQEKASPKRQPFTQPALPRQETKPTTEPPAKDSSIPSNIPKLGGAKTVSLSGVSMSGIALTEDAVNLYYLIRAKSTYKWATWQIDDAGTKVIISAVGEPSSHYSEFLSALPEQDCRYGGKFRAKTVYVFKLRCC